MISNEQLIFDKLCSIYPDALSDVTGLSYNDSGNRQFIICDAVGFNFDKVLNCSGAYKASYKERSPDALFCNNSTLYFIEFKEGGSNKEDIRLKIHEGITTLYHFVCKYMPSLTRQQFVELNINYAVVCRGDGTKSALSSEMLKALENSSKKYSLKNLEGLILKKTAVMDEPLQVLRFLNKLTSGVVTKIRVFEYLGQTRDFDLTA
ncbi:hypothetical protein ACI00F_003596 [Cronobacter dublinensis]|uniref:hypothetical protein n=1 Tax=Cronobacter sakazakii TaxID=28141 RepID=UPI001BAD9F08|nr:hypothetical protein [Cronobacter sakazakii]MBR9956458.1 hypothetical protein [Cronobacter sakazakii]